MGESFTTFSSANGKAALSLMSNDEIVALLKGGLFEETSHTITRMSELLVEIEQVRKDNIAIDNEEHTEGICAFGTAFHDPFGRPTYLVDAVEIDYKGLDIRSECTVM